MTQPDGEPRGNGRRFGLSARARIRAVVIAIVIVLGLAVIYLWAGEAVDEQIAPSERETAEAAPPEPGPAAEISWITLSRLPADLRSSEGELIGSVFIDVELAIRGEDGKNYLEEKLSDARLAILGALARNGIGKADAPLEIDRERLADLLKSATNEALEQPVIVEVRVSGNNAEHQSD